MKVINLNHRVILNEGPIQSTEFTNTFNYETERLSRVLQFDNNQQFHVLSIGTLFAFFFFFANIYI